VQLSRRILQRVFLSAAVLSAFLIVRNWAYVTTYRLYVTHRTDTSIGSTTSQRFEIENGHVSPQIVTRGDDAIRFEAADAHPSMLHAQVRSDRTARYEVRWTDRSGERVLTSGSVAASSDISSPVPPGPGIVTLVNGGAVTWIDPRLVRKFRAWPSFPLLALSAIGAVVFSRGRSRLPTIRAGVVVVSGMFAALFAEGGLRLLGEHLPPGIAAERHDLGEVHRDPRWVETQRYGRRLRPNVDLDNEWRYGDIVRMGFVPPDVSDGTVHRFRFRTDAEGFRNVQTRDFVDIAALGDSFTDAMTLSADDGWTTRLAVRTGLTVQNYGTAGFGPQQELRVLQDYAIHRRPRIVVLAFFAGNDIFDAEAFDEFERTGSERASPGWQIKDVVSRADNWFVVSALHAAAAWTTTRQRVEARDSQEQPRVSATSGEDPVVFDRGMFTAAVNGSRIRFAFMPPYLNTLTFSERELSERAGWRLTREALIAMRDVSRGVEAQFVVMFLPFKAQVYLPWLRSNLSDDQLGRSLEFYLPDRARKLRIEALMENRLAQNRMMQAFCDQQGIAFLDVSDALEARVLSGENVYFPDESHLNEAGHAVVADALARYLGQLHHRPR
jgi:lysophospholipase L1-like esterase